MSLRALELELKRVNNRLWRYRLIWLGVWVLAAISSLPLIGEGNQQSGYVSIFLVFVFVALFVTFYLQHVYFRDVHKKQQLVSEAFRGLGGA
jgi:uncharacterized membrane protein